MNGSTMATNPNKLYNVTTRIKDYEAIRILKAADVEDAEEKAISFVNQTIQAGSLEEAINIAIFLAKESNINKPIGIAGYREYKVVSVAEVATIDISYDQYLRTKHAVEEKNKANSALGTASVLQGPATNGKNN